MPENTYVPGVCNIGDAEIAQRNRVGWIGLIATIIVAVLFSIYHIAIGWRLLTFFPATFGATGFLQAWMHFCAGFGMKGVFNFSGQVNKTDTVAQAEYRAKDRAKAISIIVYSILIGIAVMVVVCIL